MKRLFIIPMMVAALLCGCKKEPTVDPPINDSVENPDDNQEPDNPNVRTFTVNGVSFDMIRVEGGTFTMGASPEEDEDAYYDEYPPHTVTLSTFFIGETEVSQALWVAVMGNNPSNWVGDNLPVDNVSWKMAKDFIAKLNQLTGDNFSLPTEAEWEYAARGGSLSHGYRYSGSNDIDSVAWYDENSGNQTHAIKTKMPNELGLYDMSGNVWEWCNDRFGYYTEDAQTDPTGPTSGTEKLVRGGTAGGLSRYCRVSWRGWFDQFTRDENCGFRLAIR